MYLVNIEKKKLPQLHFFFSFFFYLPLLHFFLFISPLSVLCQIFFLSSLPYGKNQLQIFRHPGYLVAMALYILNICVITYAILPTFSPRTSGGRSNLHLVTITSDYQLLGLDPSTSKIRLVFLDLYTCI